MGIWRSFHQQNASPLSRRAADASRRSRRSARKRQSSVVSRHPAIEQFECRLVLSGSEAAGLGPQLISIIPDQRSQLLPGETLNVAPSQLTFSFDQSQSIDANTLNGIILTRSGRDGVFGDNNDVRIFPGSLAVGAESNQVVMRFSSPLPADLYQIEIVGAGPNAVANAQGLAFNGGVNYEQEFRLDLAPQVLAVVPQPVSPPNPNSSNVRTQALNEIDVYFSEPLDPTSAQTTSPTSLYQMIATQNTSTTADDQIFTPQAAIWNSANDEVRLIFSQPLNNYLGSQPNESFRLRIGNDQAPQQAPIVVPVPPSPQDPATPNGTGPGDTFATAMALPSEGNGPGVLGNGQTEIFNSSINPLPVNTALVFPGGAGPGVPNLPVPIEPTDPRLPTGALTGIAQWVQEEGVMNHILDGQFTSPGGIVTIPYNFKNYYGTDPSGKLLTNQIASNPTWEPLIRDIFGLISKYTGVSFVETPSSGLTVAVGSILAVGPSDPATAANGIEGPTSLAPAAAIINGNVNWGNATYGGAFFDVAMDEILHALGLGTAYDAPGSLTGVQGNENPSQPAAPQDTNQMFPGNPDIQTLQYLYREDSTQVSLYKFTVTQAGTINAETFAQRLTPTSQLDTLLTLYDELSVLGLPTTGGQGIVNGSSFTIQDNTTEKTFEFTYGASIQVPATLSGGANIADSTTFSLSDGVDPPVTFEFAANGRTVTDGNIPIAFNTTDSLSTVAGDIVQAINAAVKNNGLGGGNPQIAASYAGSGLITLGAQLTASDWSSNSNLAFTPALTLSGGATPIFYAPADTPHQLAVAIADSINNSGLNVLATAELTQVQLQGPITFPFGAAGLSLSVQHDIIARNDNYFGNDSFMSLALQPGVYYVAVSSAGNDQFNPDIANSGWGGTTAGMYELRLNFQTTAATSGALVSAVAPVGMGLNVLGGDAPQPLDGAGNGVPGSAFNFWFNVGPTTFVDKLGDLVQPATMNPDGSVGANAGNLVPSYTTIQAALAANPALGSNLRIEGNGGAILQVPIDQTGSNAIAAGQTFTIGAGTAVTGTATFEFFDGDSIQVTAGGSAVSDGSTFTIAVGTKSVTFEFANLSVIAGSTLADGNLAVPFTAESRQRDLGVNIVAAINAAAAAGLFGTADILASYSGLFNGNAVVSLGDKVPAAVTPATVTTSGGPPLNFVRGTPMTLYPRVTAVYYPAGSNGATIGQQMAAAIDTTPLIDRAVGNLLVLPRPTSDANNFYLSFTQGQFTSFGDASNRITINTAGQNGQPGTPDLTTILKDQAYQIGINNAANNNAPLADGSTFNVPQGVTVMVDPGAELKLRQAIIDVGSNAQNINRGEGALQVLGVPGDQVIFTSFNDNTVGGTLESPITAPAPGDWGGIVFQQDSGLEPLGIFLNYVDEAVLRYGGGKVLVNGVLQPFDPIEMVTSRPTVTNNIIVQSAQAPISGDPNSFQETHYQQDITILAPSGYQLTNGQTFSIHGTNFEFQNENSPNTLGVQAGYIAVPYNGIPQNDPAALPVDNADQVAVEIAAAINGAQLTAPITQAAVTGDEVTITSVALDSAVAIEMVTPASPPQAVNGATANLAGSTFAVKSGVFEFFDGDSLQLLASGSQAGLDKSTFTIALGSSSVTFEFAINERPVTDRDINGRPDFGINFNQTDSIATLGREITAAINAAAAQGLFGAAPVSASYSGEIGTGPAVISLGDLAGTTVTFNFQPSLPPTALTFLSGSANMTLVPNEIAVHFSTGDTTGALAREIAAAVNGAQIDGGTGALVYAEAVNAVDGPRVDFMNSSDINLSSPGAAPLTLALLSPLAVRPTSGANLNDGETFNVNGQVFEYDQGTTITPPNSGGPGVVNGDSFTITDGATGTSSLQFVFYVNYQGFFQTPQQLPTLQANQRAVFVNSNNPLNQNFIDVLATLTGSQAVGAQFTLTTGTSATTFEITDGSITLPPGILPVLVNAADNAGTIAQKISAAINLTGFYDSQPLPGPASNEVQITSPAFPTTISISTDAPSRLLVSVVPGIDTPAQVGNDILQAILTSGLANVVPEMLAGPSGAVRVVSTGSVLPLVDISKAAELKIGASLNGGVSVPFAPGFSPAQVATSIATAVTTAGIGVSATAGTEVTITAPATGGAGITSGDSFTITEGASTANFVLLQVGSTVPPGSFPVFYSPGDTQAVVAQEISAEIYAAAAAGMLTNLTATPVGGVVQLITASGSATSVNLSKAPELTAGPSTPIVTFEGADSVVPLGPASTDGMQATITAPAAGAAGIAGGDSFTITAGTRKATFVFTPAGGALPSAGFPVYYTSGDNQAAVAQDIYSAIYAAVATGSLTNLRATASGGVVQLIAAGTGTLSVDTSSAPELSAGASTPVVTFGAGKSVVPLEVPSFTMNTDAAPLGLLNNFYTADYQRAGPDIHGNILAVRQPQILTITDPTKIADGQQVIISNVGFQFTDNNQTAPGFIPISFTAAQLTAANAADLVAQDVLTAIDNATNPGSPFFQAGFNVQPVLGPSGSGQVLLLLGVPSIYSPSVNPLGTTLLYLLLNAVPARVLGKTPLTVRQPVIENTTNGLFVGTPSLLPQTDEYLGVTAVFASTDITYVLAENLNLIGEPGGPLGTVGRESARLQVDPGVIVKLHTAYINVGMGANLVAESDPNHRITFTSLFDDTVGSGGTFYANGDDQNPSGAQPVAPGDWGGLYFSPTSQGSLDYVTVNYAGGQAPVGGGFVPFDPVEIHQAKVRITDSTLENSGNGATTSDRNGLGPNADPVTFGALTSGVIYVINAQPVIVNNIIQNNAIPVTANGTTTFVGGAAISINADSLNENQVPDWGRSTGPISRFSQFDDNRGALVRLNKLGNNAINGMIVRGGTLTTNSVWDDTDIVHVVESNLTVGNGLTLALESSPTQSLVVKLSTVNSASLAGLTATGTPNDVTTRIGGTLQILGQPGHPVVLTALTDCSVGAGLTPANGPDNETDNGNCGTQVGGGSGPAFVDGGDIDKHGDNLGPGGTNEGGWLLVQEALTFVYSGSRNTNGTGILVIGAQAGNTAQEAVTSAAAGAGLPAPTFITGAAISTVDFSKYRMIYVPSTDPQTPGGISQSDLDLLTARKADVQTYVNDTGGGLIALTEVSSPTPFSWLALPDLLQTTSYGSGGNLDPLVATAAMRAAGFNISNADINLGTPWHEGFDGPPGFDNMQPFILDAVTGEVEALGLPAGSTGIGGTGAAPGSWNTVAFDQYANDANLATIDEQESAYTGGNGVNNTPGTAEFLGQLAPNLQSGSDSQRLGFQVHGSISLNDPHDIDTYSFTAVPGTQAWFDVGQTSPALDTVLELVDANGNVLARSDSAALEQQDAIDAGNPLAAGPMLKGELPPTSANPAGNLALPLESSTFTGGVAPAINQTNFGSINPKDPGFRAVLPGSGTTPQTYYVRIYSRGPASNPYLPNLGPAPQESNGLSSGLYALQIRLQQQAMSPGSTVSYADIRFARNGITVLGQPADSPLLGNSAAAGGNSSYNIGVTSNNAAQYTGGQPNGVTNSQDLGNLLTTPSNSLTVSGNLQDPGQVDWYKFSLNYNLQQAIQGINAGDKTWSTVFDVGYADGLTRPDTSISVYDQWGNLILSGRSSDVADQQPTPTQGLDATNLSHSSFGTNDPFIGPAQLPAGEPGADFPAAGSTYPLPITTDPPPGQGTSSQNGPDSFTYFVAISSAATLPVAMDANFNAASANTLVRLQPVDSTQYIVNDHIGYTGFTSGNAGMGGGTQILPQDGPVLPIKTIAQLQQEVQPYTLDNMSLYVSTGTGLFTADPGNGAGETEVGGYNLPGSLGGGQVQDIAIRTDGLMFGYADDHTTDSDSGHLLQINTGTAQITDLGGDGAAQKWGTLKHVGALAYDRLPGKQPNFSNWSQYHLFLAADNAYGGSDILYANPQNGDTTSTSVPYFDTGSLPTGVSVLQGTATGLQIFTNDTSTGKYVPSSFTVTDQASPANTIQFIFWNSSETLPAGVKLNTLYPPTASNPNYTYYFSYATGDSSQTILTEMAGAINSAFSLLPASGVQEPFAQVLIYKSAPDILQISNAAQADFTDAPEFGVGVVTPTPGGHIRGMAVDLNNDELYAALDSGAIYEVPIFDGIPAPEEGVFLTGSMAFVNRHYEFQGLTLGPQNMNWNVGAPNTGPGDLADVMIGVALDNNPNSATYGEDVLTAFDVIPSLLFPQAPGSPVAVFDTPASIPAVLPNGLGNTYPQVGPPTGTLSDHTLLTDPTGTPFSDVTGIALSPLDFNLWHPTYTDPAQPAGGDAAGHGVPTAFDNSNQPFTVPGNNTQIDQFKSTVSWIDSTGAETSVTMPQSTGGVDFYYGLDPQTANYPVDGQLVTSGSATGEGPLNYTGQLFPKGASGQPVTPQYGVIDPEIQADLNSNPNIANTYNLPGGDSGTLVTQPFSLAGYSSGQQPTLYFNYFLNTGLTNNSTQGWKSSARAFVSPDGGRSWDEIATNDPRRGVYNPAYDPMTGSIGSRQYAQGTYPNVLTSSELPYVDTASSQIPATTINGQAVVDPRQQVQQLYDATGTWRQGRVDLSNYAGDPNLLIRFDFSTSGAILNPVADNSYTTPIPGDNFANNWGLGMTDNGRENNNQHPGFAITDILVGLAGRGEMVSGSDLNNDGTTRQPPTSFFTVPQNPTFGAPTQVLTGSYVLQIRQGTASGETINPNTSGMILNPNPLNASDRLTQAFTLLAPAGHFNQTQTLPDSNQITFQNLPAPSGNGTLTFTVTAMDTLIGSDEWLALDFPGQPSLSQKIFFTPQDKGVPGETFTTATVALTLPQLQALIQGNQLKLTLTPEGGAAGATIADNTTVTLDYASDLIQGQTFTISDGVNQRTFQFTDNNQLTNPSYIPVSYTPNDTAAQLAQDMIAAINSPGLFNVYAASGDANNNSVNAANTPNDTSNRVNLFKAAWVWVGPPQVTISNPQAAPPPRNTIAAALSTGLDSTTNGVRTFNGYGVIGNAAGVGTSANIDMLQVHLNKGDAMSIALDTKSVLSLLNPVLRIFDSQETNLTGNLLDAAGNSYGYLLGISTNGFVPASMLAPPPPGAPGVYDDYYLTFTAPATGNYYLAVSGAGNATYDPKNANGALPGSTGFYEIHLNVGAIDTRGAGPVANPTNLAQNAGFRFGENYSVQTVQQDVNVGIGSSFNFQPSTSVDTAVQIVKYDYQGDSTVTPLQGQFVLLGAEITNSLNDGILVSAGPREGLPGQVNSNLPHQGVPLTLIQPNTDRLVPGVSLTNNLIDGFGHAGIQFTGDANAQPPLAAVPYGRIVNNTIYGGAKPGSTSVGIDVTNSASPTMLNNIVANTGTGIFIDASSQSLGSPPVLGENLYQNDKLNTNINLTQFPTGDPGTNGDVLTPTDPLFVNAAAGNFYLQRFSLAIDSAINSLADRAAYVNVTGPLGIPPLPVQAPNTDIFGQLRVADPNDAVPNGLGANIYKDRGAVERADFTGPIAVMLNPADNSILDQDPRVNFVQTVGQNFSEFDIELNDGTGPGIDNSTVAASEVTVRRNGVLLTPGIDYGFVYDNNNHIIRLIAAAGVWANGSVYNIALDNGVEFDPLNPTIKPVGIRDLAGNLLQADFPNGFTTFQITLQDSFNDPPAVILPRSAQVYEHDSLVFNSTSSSGNPDQPTFANDFAGPIRIFDVDANGGVEQVTLTASAGVLSIAGLPSNPTLAELQALGLTSATGNGTGTLVLKGVLGDATVSPPQLGLNYALTQLVYTPDPASNPYFNGPATIILVANDLGNSGPGPAGQKPPFPQQTTVNFSVNVIAVNNPPANTVPVVPAGPEDTPITFSQAQGNAITVSDPDIVGTNNSNPQYLYLEKLTAIHGTLTLAPGSGATPAPGSSSTGSGTNSLAFVGTLAAVNTALDGLTFTPDGEYYSGVPWAGNRIGFAGNVSLAVGSAPTYALTSALSIPTASPTEVDISLGSTGVQVNGQTITATVNFGNSRTLTATFEFDDDGHGTTNVPIDASPTDNGYTLTQEAVQTINATFAAALQNLANVAGNPAPSNQIGLSFGATAVTSGANLALGSGGSTVNIVAVGSAPATGLSVNGQTLTVSLPVGTGAPLAITFEFDSDNHPTANVPIVINATDDAQTLALDAAQTIDAAFLSSLSTTGSTLAANPSASSVVNLALGASAKVSGANLATANNNTQIDVTAGTTGSTINGQTFTVTLPVGSGTPTAITFEFDSDQHSTNNVPIKVNASDTANTLAQDAASAIDAAFTAALQGFADLAGNPTPSNRIGLSAGAAASAVTGNNLSLAGGGAEVDIVPVPSASGPIPATGSRINGQTFTVTLPVGSGRSMAVAFEFNDNGHTTTNVSIVVNPTDTADTLAQDAAAAINAAFAAAVPNLSFLASDLSAASITIVTNDQGNIGVGPGPLHLPPPVPLIAENVIPLTFNVVNEAPTLDGSTTMTLNSIYELPAPPSPAPAVYTTANNGTKVSDILFTGGSTANSDLHTPITLHATANPKTGIAITAVDALSAANGTWQYSLDGGNTWTNFPAVSLSNALLLDASDFVRFLPNNFFVGTLNPASNPLAGTVNFTFQAWDETLAVNSLNGNVVSLSPGSTADLSTNSNDTAPIGTGGSTPFSTTAATAALSIVAVDNSPPTIAPPGGTFTTKEDTSVTLAPIAVNDANSFVAAGQFQISITVSGGLNNQPAGKVTLASTNGLTFISGANDSAAMTFTGLLGTSSPASGIDGALSGLVFSPQFDFAGQATITIQASDETSTFLGGPLKSLPAVFTISVTPVHQAPILDMTQAKNSPSFTGYPENTPVVSNQGGSVLTMLQSAGNIIYDGIVYDPKTNSLVSNPYVNIDQDAGGQVGIVITALNSVGLANGTWQYSTNGGVTWLAIAPVSTTSALVLSGSDLVRYLPNQNFFGNVQLTFNLWDETNGAVDGSRVNLNGSGTTGGNTAYSSASTQATLTVGFVDQPPSFSLQTTSTLENNTAALSGNPAPPNAGVIAVPNFAYGVSAGPSNAPGLAIQSFTVTTDAPNLFTATGQPKIVFNQVTRNGDLSYQLAPDVFGTAKLTVTATNNGLSDPLLPGATGTDTSPPHYTTITVVGINDPPTFNMTYQSTPLIDTQGQPLPAINLMESANPQAQTVNLSNVTAGLDETQVVDFTVASSNPGLVPTPLISYTNPNTTGTLTFTPLADVSGTATITVTLTDNGGTANGGMNTTTEQFQVNVASNVPTATPQTVPAIENTPQPIPLQGTDPNNLPLTAIITALPANGTLYQTPDGSTLGAAITSANTSVTNANGVVIYQPDKYEVGSPFDSFQFAVTDGTATSTPAAVSIDVSLIDPPKFSLGPNPHSTDVLTQQSIANFATILSPAVVNPPATPEFAYHVQVTGNAAMFAVAPAISPSGTLTYTLASNVQPGTSATVSVTLQFTGQVAAGGTATSPAQTFTISTNAVPTAANHTFELSVGSSSSATAADGLLAGATGSGTLVPAIVQQPTNGTLTVNADGSFTYTKGGTFQGFDSFTYEVTDGLSVSNVATVNIISYEATIVQKLYHQVLHRDPDPAGWQYWVSKIQSGASYGVIAQGIFESNEHLDPIIEGFYEQFLLRPADPQGLAYWRDQVWKVYGGQEPVVAGMISSPEFFAESGGTNVGWVTQLYERLLGRAPEQQGLNFWVNQLNSGAETQYQVVFGFEDSLEYHTNLVNSYFQEYLGVPPTPEQLSLYVGQLQTGASDRDIQIEIINTPQYANTPPPPSPGSIRLLS